MTQPPAKPGPFTEEKIRARAKALWQARMASVKVVTEAEHWEPDENDLKAAVESLELENSLPKSLRSLWSPTPSAEAQKIALELHKLQLEQVKVWVAVFSVLATIFAGGGLYLTYRNGQEQQAIALQQQKLAQEAQQLNSDRQVTDRFSKAVEQLGSGDVHVRIGGIYSLERLARDSPQDHWTIMEVLTAYVRDKSPLPKGWLETPPEKRKPLELVTTDVQSALTVIGRREVKQDPAGRYLNLSRSNLSSANLSLAKLSSAFLFKSNLSGADLMGTIFKKARLKDTIFKETDINRADFTEATGITLDQIKQAGNWQQAHYDDDLRLQLGLPPENPSTSTPQSSMPQPSASSSPAKP